MASFSERTITERWTRRGRVSSDEHSIIPFLGTHIHVLLGLPRPTTPSFHLANVKRSLLFPAALSAPTHRTRPSWPQVWPVIINRVLNFPPHLICNGCYRIRRARKTSRKEIVDVHNARGEDSSRSDDWNRKISEKKYSSRISIGRLARIDPSFSGKNIFRIIRNIFDDPLYTFRRRLEDKLIFICARLEIIDDWWGQRVKGASSGTTVESRSGQPRVFETNYAAGGRRLHRPKYKAQMPVFAVIICLEEFKKWTAEDGEDGGEGRRQTGRQKGGCQLVARERERKREKGGRSGGRERKTGG